MATIVTTEIKHFMVWHYAHNQYCDTEPWLWRHTVYRVRGCKVWTRREKKVYLPIWSWAAHAFNGLPKQFYSGLGGEPVDYDYDTGEITVKRRASAMTQREHSSATPDARDEQQTI